MKYYLAEAYESENRDGEARKQLDEVLKSTPDPKVCSGAQGRSYKANKLSEKISNVDLLGRPSVGAPS